MQMSVFFHTQKKKKNIIRRASNSRVCFSGPGKVCESIEKKKVVFLFLVYFLQDSPVFFFFVCHSCIAACGASGLARLLIMRCLILEQEAELRVKMFRQGRTLPQSGRRYAYL